MIVSRLRLFPAALACSTFVLAGCSTESRTADTAAPGPAREDASTAVRTPTEVAALPSLTPELQQLLARIREADTGQLAISEEDGRFLRLMIVLNRTQKAIEIGGASGYSAIWLGLGLRDPNPGDWLARAVPDEEHHVTSVQKTLDRQADHAENEVERAGPNQRKLNLGRCLGRIE